MKKAIIVFTISLITTFAHAQNSTLTSKNGTPVLPEEKDWAFGIDAAPFFDIIKGMFSSSDSGNADYTRFTKDHPLTLYGKLVKGNNTIWRVSGRLHYGSDKTNYITLLDSADGSWFSPTQYGNDVMKESHKGVALGFGIEKRRGKGRIQGYYGPEVRVGFHSSKKTIDYANEITKENQLPDISPAFDTLLLGARITEINYGSQFDFGLRGFIGVEYFFLAKASIGAELGWGISFTTSGEPDSKIEFWDPSLNSGAGGVNRQRIPGDNNYAGKTSGLNIDTDNAYGAVSLLFYF